MNATRWQQIWYGGDPLYRLLLPLSWFFGAVVALRRALYRRGIARSFAMPVPVIVVGNINIGGVGKTPVVLDVLRRLTDAGFKPGVVSRGYGGRIREPTPVLAGSDPAQVGDEPVLIAGMGRCPVVVAPNRVRAARLLLAQGVNIIVADDGLQHYALRRDIEIAVMDGERRLGNGWLLPAGPLREPPARLDEVDIQLINGTARPGEFALQSSLGPAVQLTTGRRRELSEFETVHAVAGIAHPEKFFAALEASGLKLQRHAFPDHWPYTRPELQFADQLPVLMTRKDAVKCQRFHDARLWAVEHHTLLPEAAWQELLGRLPRPPGLIRGKERTHG